MSAPAQLAVLLQMRLRQWFNRLSVPRRRKGEDKREATLRTQHSSWLRMLLFALLFLFQSFYIAQINLAQLPQGFIQSGQLRPLILLLTLLLLCALFSFRSQELVGLDDENAWLLALPVSSYFIGILKILEHSLFNSFAWIMGLGFFAAAFELLAYSPWQIILLAPLFSLLLNFQVALLYYPLLLCFRRFFSGPLLQNIQAFFTLCSMFSMVGLLSYARFTDFFEPVADWRLPLTELLEAVTGERGSYLYALGGYGVLLLGAGLAVNFTAVGGLELSRRLSGRTMQGSHTMQGYQMRWGQHLPAVLYRDMILLLRDRNLSMKILLLPLLVLCMQFVLASDLMDTALSDPRRWTLLALALGTYSLQSGAINLLSHESDMLWQWFSLPTALSRLLIQKACFWGGITLLYAVLTWLMGWFWLGAPLKNLWLLAWLFVAVALQALNAVALGVLGLDPDAGLGQPRLSPESRSMFFLGSAMLAFSLYAPELQAKWVSFLIYGAYSLALWQKALTRLPLLLDASAVPLRRLHLSDSLSAVLLFFFIQLLVGMTGFWLEFNPATVAFWSFTAAGLIVVPSTLLALRSQGLPLKSLQWWQLKMGVFPATVLALSLAAMAFLGARSYLWFLIASENMPAPAEVSLPFPLLLLLSICVAPVIEEILFRGLLQQSLLPLLGFQRAWIFSSLLFALMHPGISALPVFGLSLAAGWVYHRTGHLGFAIGVHAIYNLGVLLIQI